MLVGWRFSTDTGPVYPAFRSHSALVRQGPWCWSLILLLLLAGWDLYVRCDGIPSPRFWHWSRLQLLLRGLRPQTWPRGALRRKMCFLMGWHILSRWWFGHPWYVSKWTFPRFLFGDLGPHSVEATSLLQWVCLRLFQSLNIPELSDYSYRFLLPRLSLWSSIAICC